MLALCLMLLPCYYAQNNASIMCQSVSETLDTFYPKSSLALRVYHYPTS